MKIKRLRIEKFRAVRYADINFTSITALVGQNSAGKSTVLRALNAFFNFEEEKIAFEKGSHDFQKNSASIIDLEFSNVAPDCQLSRVKNQPNMIRLRLKYRKTSVWEIHSDGKWVPAPQNWREQLSNYMRYFYVPLKRNHEVVAWGTLSLLRKAVEAWVANQTKNRDRISPKIAAITKDIQEKTFTELSKELKKIVPVSADFFFELSYRKQPDYTLLLNDLVLMIKESGRTVALEDCGSGTQSLTSLALYAYLADLEKTTYLLGIEEPEQNLHPHMQRDLIATLKNLPLQVVITTHSPAIVDSLNHEDIVLCRRTTSATRGIEIETTQLSNEFWKKTGLDKEKYEKFYERKNSDFFFADFVLVTESLTDAEIIKNIVEQSAGRKIFNGVTIISLDGKNYLPYIFHLLKELKLKYAIALDKDYFLDYAEGDKDKSRDKNGFPKYKKTLKKNSLVSKIIPNLAERQRLEKALTANHSEAMDILEKESVFCFRWELETDLVASSSGKKLLCQKLSVPDDEKAEYRLLVEKRRVMKELETIRDVVLALNPTSMPNSYKRIRKVLPKKILQAKNLAGL